MSRQRRRSEAADREAARVHALEMHLRPVRRRRDPIPVVGDSIVGAGSAPAISGPGTKYQDASLAGWTTVSLAAGDILAFVIEVAATAITRCTISLKIVKLAAAFTILSVNLSVTTLNMPTANAGDVIGAVTVTTSPPGGAPSGPVVLGGPDAALFALTNRGVIPCNLVVGASDVLAGSYNITLTAS